MTREQFLEYITTNLNALVYVGAEYPIYNALFRNDKEGFDYYNTRYLRAQERIAYWMGQYDLDPSFAIGNFTSDLGSASVNPTDALEWPPTDGIFGDVITDPVQVDWNQAGSGSLDYIKNKPSLATVATSGSYNDLSNKPSIPSAQVNSDWTASSGVAQILNKPAARSQSSASRSLNSAFQINASRDCLVNYSVEISSAITLTTGQTGTVFLEIASDSGFTANVQELGRFTNGNSGTLTIGLALTQIVTANLNGYVPPGYYCRLRTANTVGTPTFTYRSGQEVLL